MTMVIPLDINGQVSWVEEYFVQLPTIADNDSATKSILSLLSLYFTLIDDHIDCRKELRDAIANVERKSRQFSAIQKRIVSQKSNNKEALGHLLDRTYELVIIFI
jgi:hypothetical protein